MALHSSLPRLLHCSNLAQHSCEFVFHFVSHVQVAGLLLLLLLPLHHRAVLLGIRPHLHSTLPRQSTGYRRHLVPLFVWIDHEEAKWTSVQDENYVARESPYLMQRNCLRVSCSNGVSSKRYDRLLVAGRSRSHVMRVRRTFLPAPLGTNATRS